MSLLDDVSIVVTPNGYKAGELYAVIPVPTEGAEQVVNGDFATDSDWVKGTGWTISGDTANCNNTSGSTQDLKTENRILNLGGKRVQISFTVSNYSGSASMTVTLQGTGGNDFSGINANGTYTTLSLISPTDNSIDLLFKASNGWVGSIDNVSVKEYTSADMDVTRSTAATRVDENGLIEDVLSNVPRIDYTGGGCPHILAEPQRTNLITYSEDFSDSSWSKNDVSETSGFTSPDGTDNAYKVLEDTTTSTHFIKATNVFTADGTDRAQTIYVKPIGRRYIAISSGTDFTNNNNTLIFDTQLGDWGLNSSSNNLGLNSSVDENGWWRLVFKSDATSGAYDNFSIGTAIADLSYADANFTGDSSKGFYIWGAQVEAGSYATSYIPTSGSTVTRNQDIFTRDGIGSLINSTEGVLFVEAAALSNDGTNRFLFVSDGTNDNGVRFYYSTTNNQIILRYYVGGAATAIISFTLPNALNFNKIAFKWKVNDFALWVDGVEVGTDSSGAVLSANTLNSVSLTTGVGASPFFSKVKQLQVYKTALTDDTLALLTS